MAKPIVVIGSINMDMVCRTPRIPVPGETIVGSAFTTIPGGKGANQAVASALLGGDVYMVGRVGDDDFGRRLLDGLIANDVHTDQVVRTNHTSSGCAMILVDKKGENSIVVIPGANAKVTPEDVDAARDLIASAGAVVLQLEIPLATAEHAIRLARELGVPTILDPAPAIAKLPAGLFDVDILTPNESEAELLLGLDVSRDTKARRATDPRAIAADLVARGARSVILKLGRRGCLSADTDGRVEKAGAYKIRVTDSTAAGDAFTGALAVGLVEGMERPEMIRFANAAGALCCQAFGAQPSLPTRAAVDEFRMGE